MGECDVLTDGKATQPDAPRDGALLTSPEWSGQNQPQCLEFWYEYGGTTDPTLQVEVKADGKSEVAWQLPSHPSKVWMLARAQISQDKTFQVIFRAKFGKDLYQFVGLDNVVLRPEPCVHTAECDFNDGLCGYVNQFRGNFQWLVGTGRYEQPKLQPAVPREKDTPPFAYLDLTTGTSDTFSPVINSMKRNSNTVRLLSPLFDVTNENTQLAIRYYRRGPDVMTANVSVTCYGKASDKTQPQVQSSTEMGEVSQWTTLKVPVKQGSACQLALIVTRGQGTNGTIAISSVNVESLAPALTS
ncbi:apical endosomal glycoprotein-like [Rhipicephalus sanguineus]|uniref:apical endosomal glycoprotein-like n=1 Tax=Rhipicephalus sanguineus TaxID=34632 RepID=UPI0020C1EFB3|nr:apical endosomal glycoprotein-like [Rhipicephalus sanguineus]